MCHALCPQFLSHYPAQGSDTKVQANGLRKDALFLGTAWTLVLAGLLCWFKSSPARPIFLLSLAGAGVVSRAILVHALPDGLRAARDGG
jgi:hypothetical protein